MGAVIGVLGGSGGVGASTFAAMLAATAAAADPAVLVDLDVTAGGVDVLLAIEHQAGARWSGVHLAGGRLDPELLVGGLPVWAGVAVLAADVPALDPAAVLEVLEAASAAGTVIVDLPRRSCAEQAAALVHCDLAVVVARGDVAGLVAARTGVAALPELPLGLVVRRGEVSAADAATLVGCPLLGALPGSGGGAALDPARLPRASARVAAGILRGLEPAQAGRHAAPVPA